MRMQPPCLSAKERRRRMGDIEKIKSAASIRDYAEAHLTKDRAGRWCCPSCGSGARGTYDSDSALSVTPDGNHWECFACGANGDVLDMAGAVIGSTSKREQIEAVSSWAGIDLERHEARRGMQAAARRALASAAEKNPGEINAAREKEADKIKTWRGLIEAPEATAYLEARKITLEQAQTLGIGYDPTRRRIVLPWRGCDWYHIDRDVTGEARNKYDKPRRADVGVQPLYNPEAVKAPAYFVVEGVLDALSVELAGYEAVAVASSHISNANVSELATAANVPGSAVAILMLDNDEAGREGARKIAEAFDALGIAHVDAPPMPDGIKDASEYREADSDGLRAFLSRVYEQAQENARATEEEAYREALRGFRVLDPADIATDIYTLSAYEEPTPTGIRGLDDALDGGIRSGLIALGAVSSMGKTTLSVQVADYIAGRGRPVLFVTIEQSAHEIVAKSLSRTVRERNETGYNVVSTLEAVTPSRRKRWSDAQSAVFADACSWYASHIAPNLRILEGTKQPSVKNIETVARMMKRHHGVSPVVFVDYLQLLESPDQTMSDKQATDRNVKDLRQLARDLKSPVWVISSLNRSSYSEGVTMDSWKESGAIEYSCDVLLGLQPQGLRDLVERTPETRGRRTAEAAMRKNKAAAERPCELVVIKNRNGAMPADGIPLTFKPLSALYVEGSPRANSMHDAI